MINVNKATQKAVEYLNNFYPTAKAILLEEIEIEGQIWLVTLSFFSDDPSPSGNIFGVVNRRKYKLFKINAENGDFIAMKIREI